MLYLQILQYAWDGSSTGATASNSACVVVWFVKWCFKFKQEMLTHTEIAKTTNTKLGVYTKSDATVGEKFDGLKWIKHVF